MADIDELKRAYNAAIDRAVDAQVVAERAQHDEDIARVKRMGAITTYEDALHAIDVAHDALLTKLKRKETHR